MDGRSTTFGPLPLFSFCILADAVSVGVQGYVFLGLVWFGFLCLLECHSGVLFLLLHFTFLMLRSLIEMTAMA